MAVPGHYNGDVVKGVQITSILRHGSGTVGTVAAALTSVSTNINWIILQADDDNSGDIFAGNSTVANSGSSAGIRLDAGDSAQFVIDDLSSVYVIGSAAGQTYRYLAGSP